MTTISARKAAELLGISDAAVRKRIANGSLAAVKEKGAWKIPLEEIHRIQAQKGAANAEDLPPDTQRKAEIQIELLQRELAELRQERDYLRQEVERLHQRLEQLEGSLRHAEQMNDRLSLLLANEQAQRLRALPSSKNFLRRLFRRSIPFRRVHSEPASSNNETTG